MAVSFMGIVELGVVPFTFGLKSKNFGGFLCQTDWISFQIENFLLLHLS